MVFHNGSNYDYHIIIKELAEEFECLREKIEKNITFSVPLEKETESRKTITYQMKFIDNVRFMSSSLSTLADNLSEGLYKNRSKDCKSDLEYLTVLATAK